MKHPHLFRFLISLAQLLTAVIFYKLEHFGLLTILGYTTIIVLLEELKPKK